MTSCPRPKSVSCQKDEDCSAFVKNTTDSSQALCIDNYCEHACMLQYDGALPSYGKEVWENWCGATNDGVPWGSVCVNNKPFEKDVVPIQCALPSQNYVCPQGWTKALWNNGEASKMILCQSGEGQEIKESSVNCFEKDDIPCCSKSSDGAPLAKCGNC